MFQNETLISEGFAECCGHNSTPIPAEVFTKCFYNLSPVIARNHSKASLLGVSYFDIETHELKVYRLDFTTKDNWSGNFAYMESLYNRLQDWMSAQLSSAPSSLKHGWLAAYYDAFEFYDLQRALASGTYSAIGVSMAAAFIVMLITSRSVLITVYAIFTIFLTISVTFGSLVLLGWELNIAESVTLTLAPGLSIDFCIHYGMAYRLSKKCDRGSRVQESLEKVGSATLMAAATTFIAGVCMMPATIWFYIQLGTFLMLVMPISWMFATFFFQSLCYVLGPKRTLTNSSLSSRTRGSYGGTPATRLANHAQPVGRAPLETPASQLANHALPVWRAPLETPASRLANHALPVGRAPLETPASRLANHSLPVWRAPLGTAASRLANHALPVWRAPLGTAASRLANHSLPVWRAPLGTTVSWLPNHSMPVWRAPLRGPASRMTNHSLPVWRAPSGTPANWLANHTLIVWRTPLGTSASQVANHALPVWRAP